MKTRNFESSFDVLAVFALNNEQMTKVRGGDEGDGEPTNPPIIPPVKI